MSKDNKIDYVEFPAGDFDVLQAFYQAVFGWSFTDYGAEYREFSDGTMKGGLYHSDRHSSTNEGAALVVIYADNLEATLEKVKTAGGKIVKEIISFPGGRRFQFTDPHGNELGVWSDK